MGSEQQHFQFRLILCSYIVNVDIFMCLQSYIPCEYDSEREYIDEMKFWGSKFGNEAMIFTTMQFTGKDIVAYINGHWEQHCPSGTFKNCTKMPCICIALKLDILTPTMLFKFHYLRTFHTTLHYVYIHLFSSICNFYKMWQCILFMLLLCNFFNIHFMCK